MGASKVCESIGGGGDRGCGWQGGVLKTGGGEVEWLSCPVGSLCGSPYGRLDKGHFKESPAIVAPPKGH